MTAVEPGAIEDYLAQVATQKRDLIARYYARVPGLVPEAEEGRSYAMPAYLYRGKGLVSVMETKRGVSVIPFSGAVSRQLPGDLDISEGAGAIRFTVAEPLPLEVFDEVVRLRRAELDAR